MNIKSHIVLRLILVALLASMMVPSRVLGDRGRSSPPKNYSGVWVAKRPDGTLLSEVTYAEGKKHGLARSWHPNGELRSSGYYRNDQLEGLSAFWDEDGVLTKLIMADPDGTHRNTKFIKGLRSEEEVLKDGILLRRRMWHSTGAKAFDYSCRNGKPHGKSTSWHPNGRIRQEGLFEDGERMGKFTTWDEAGKLQRTTHYENGKIQRIEIYENDKVVAIEHWENDNAVRTEQVK